MAQLGSTVIYGALGVTDTINGGTVYSNGSQCLTGISANQVTAALTFNPATRDLATSTRAGLAPSGAVFTDHIYSAGTNVSISASNVISATDTKYTAGTNVSISASNVISATDTTYAVFSGASASASGTTGLVPVPAAGAQAKFLRGDGTWADDNNNKVAQNNSADNANYRVLLSNTANNTDETASAKKSGNLCFNPSSGLLSTLKIDVSGSAGHGNTLFSVTDSASLTSNQISHSARFYNSNMTAGAANALLVGKEGSSKNSAYIGFYYAGSGSNDNYLRLGHYAADNQMIIKAGGNVGINTTAPSYKLDVNGDIRSQSKAYIGTGGVYISYNSATSALEFNV